MKPTNYQHRDKTRSDDARKQSQHKRARRQFATRVYLQTVKGI